MASAEGAGGRGGRGPRGRRGQGGRGAGGRWGRGGHGPSGRWGHGGRVVWTDAGRPLFRYPLPTNLAQHLPLQLVPPNVDPQFEEYLRLRRIIINVGGAWVWNPVLSAEETPSPPPSPSPSPPSSPPSSSMASS